MATKFNKSLSSDKDIQIMACHDIVKLIPAFMNNELDIKEQEIILRHLEQCDECMEELSVSYLIEIGTIRLEEGGSFNLNRELKDKLNGIRRTIKRKKYITIGIYAFEFTGIMSVVIFMFYFLLTK